ncbi:hypothetical protein F5884DRAFT_681671 [Xylogone sp. PMI_703]|nr:hypothetical protein F5884DRAFT_681671 [Xylogone sp. PMI_703]
MLARSEPLRIAIVGSGIGGLFAALSIQHFCKHGDVIVDVYEQAHEYKEIGVGVSIGINAVNLLKEVGLYDEVRAITSDLQDVWVSVRRYDNGGEIVTMRSGNKEDPSHFPVHRAEFLDLLIQAVKRRGLAALHNNEKCIKLDLKPFEDRDLHADFCSQEVGDTMILTFADGSRVTADLVVGADGIHSCVRSHFLHDDAKFDEMVVYRGLCPVSELESWWPFNTYSAMWVAPRRYFLVYPVSKGTMVNIGAFITTSKEELGDGVESWTLTGDRDDIEKEFAEFEDTVHRVVHHMDKKPLKWILYDRDPCKQWVFADGKVVLLGDTAHAMVPHQGAGAGQSLEDGYLLGRALKDFLQGKDAKALKYFLWVYQDVRLPRAEKVQVTSRENGNVFHLQSDEFKGLSYEESLPVLNKILADRLRWIWTADIDKAYQAAKDQKLAGVS